MKVAIIMGSASDMSVMEGAINILQEFGVETQVDIVSAHRTPSYMMRFATSAHKNLELYLVCRLNQETQSIGVSTCRECFL